MKNFNNPSDGSQVYETVIDGVVYRGSLSYIKRVIAEDRENRG